MSVAEFANDDDLIGALYDDALFDGDWTPALERLCGLLHASDAAFTVHASGDGRIESHTTNRILTAEARDRYVRHYHALDPKSALFANRRPNYLFNDVDHFDEDFVRRDPFYQEFSTPIDSRHTLDMLLARDSGSAVYFAAVRSARHGAFVRRDVARFRRASQHFLRVTRLRGRVTAAQRSVAFAQRALDALSFGVVVLDGAGAVIAANDAARRAALPRGGVVLTRHRIGAENVSADRALAAAIAAALAGRPSAARIVTVPRPSGGAWMVSVMPLPASSPIAAHDGGALVLIVDPASERGVRRDDLATLYGLTGAEADLAIAIAGGAQLHEIAGRRGVKLSTVRSQLLSAMQKMQVRRQADLARLLAALPTTFLRR